MSQQTLAWHPSGSSSPARLVQRHCPSIVVAGLDVVPPVPPAAVMAPSALAQPTAGHGPAVVPSTTAPSTQLRSQGSLRAAGTFLLGNVWVRALLYFLSRRVLLIGHGLLRHPQPSAWSGGKTNRLPGCPGHEAASGAAGPERCRSLHSRCHVPATQVTGVGAGTSPRSPRQEFGRAGGTGYPHMLPCQEGWEGQEPRSGQSVGERRGRWTYRRGPDPALGRATPQTGYRAKRQLPWPWGWAGRESGRESCTPKCQGLHAPPSTLASELQRLPC